MDRRWITEHLHEFVNDIDSWLALGDEEFEDPRDIIEVNRALGETSDRLITAEPVVRDLMRDARADLANFAEPGSHGWQLHDPEYWRNLVRPLVLRAIGIMTLGVEARAKLKPDSPDLVAEQFHPWVWEAAAPMWYAESPQEAVHAAARSVNARMQQKLGRHDMADARLCREAFSLNDPSPGQARLRFPGDRTFETWRSRQNGGVQFGAGCFEGIRNPAAHDHNLVLPEQIALEQLAALSVLARWIDECTVEEAQVTQPEPMAGADAQAAVTA